MAIFSSDTGEAARRGTASGSVTINFHLQPTSFAQDEGYSKIWISSKLSYNESKSAHDERGL